MVRLHVFAEGRTEQTFADTALKPHLANLGVYMSKPVLIARARKKGRVHRGGGRDFTAMQSDIRRRLKQESGNEVFFTTMIDLYALHQNFPGFEEAEQFRHDPYQRVEALEKAWSDETDDRRFIPFIQMHEFEAYLFSDVSQLAPFFDHADARIARLRREANEVGSPERINDGQHTSPSKRIIAQFPEYEGLKATVSSQAADRIGLEAIRSRCPHFAAWVRRLEHLPEESRR
jgi:hypothetical protein